MQYLSSSKYKGKFRERNVKAKMNFIEKKEREKHVLVLKIMHTFDVSYLII